MDARGVLDQLLQSGKQLMEKGKNVAEDKLGVPEDGEDRDAMVSGLGKGALAGGLLALMLGTQRGRSVTGKVIKYGSLAAVAGVAYKTYQAYTSEESDAEAASGTSITELDDASGQDRGLLLVRAMIAAANADGHISAQEKQTISEKLGELNLSDEAITMLKSEFAGPMTPEQVAEHVDSIASASEVYLLSSLVVDEANATERDFLTRLANALKLPSALVTRLEKQAFA